MDHNALSAAQLVGYAAFLFGTASLLQKSDRRLKALMAGETASYALHFFLLGNPASAATALVSLARCLLSLKYNSKRLGAVFVAIHLAAGALAWVGPWSLLPVLGSCAASWGFFAMRGIGLRAMFLLCTFLWLASNLHDGSIGGTALELVLAAANLFTIARLAVEERRLKAAK